MQIEAADNPALPGLVAGLVAGLGSSECVLRAVGVPGREWTQGRAWDKRARGLALSACP